jgi:glycerol-3-phosphate cytidylyltransferase
MKTKKKQIIGITFSTFDLFHAGHVKMLEEAKKSVRLLNCRITTESFNRTF